MRDQSPWRRWVPQLRREPKAELEEELRHHIEQRVQDYIDRGMDPESARRAAMERLGDLERVRDECTILLASERQAEARRTLVNISWLDIKLGIRVHRKYPGLTLVAVVGMAIAIAIGAGYFAAFGEMIDAALPLDEGDRIVAIRNVDTTRLEDSHASVRDYVVWRDELKSISDVGAFRTDRRNLIASDGSTELVEVAAMTASAFRATRVSPILGRTIVDEDERAGAPDVVVIGYENWLRRFDRDPGVLGQEIRLGETVHTVVGVMPEGFGFPFRHGAWVPLRLSVWERERGGGPAIEVFGRLADGFTLRQSRAELETIGHRMTVAFPDTHEHLRPQVLPYAHARFDIESPEMVLAVRAFQFAIGLLLVIVAVNVAILVYARTATRTGEIAVRSALGASRRRIVAQLFVEALILSGAAAVIGLTLAGIALRIIDDVLQRGPYMPFWVDFGLSPSVVAYVALLAVLAGGIVGVLPALKATGRRVQPALQQLSTRAAGLQLGRTWTALIVVQVAIAVAALPAAIHYAERSLWLGTRDPARAANELLRATLVMARHELPAGADSAAYERAFAARYTDRVTELIRQLESEPGVAGVTFASRFPGTESGSRFEIAEEDSAGRPESSVFYTQVNHVAIDLFDVFDIPVLAGRGFVDADTRGGATAVIVSQSFAERRARGLGTNETAARQLAGGANIIGQRVRYASRTGGDDAEAGPWLEIVGVVPDFAHDFTSPSSFDPVAPRLYHAAEVTQTRPATLVVRVRGRSPGEFAPRLRDIAATVDPALTLEHLETVAGTWRNSQKAFAGLALLVIAVMLSVLLLSAAGIYAMMAFTVARRRREIGIRSALGADPRRILTGIFARAGAQLATGIVAGLALAAALEWFGGGTMGDRGFLMLPAVSALMLTIGLLAALGPARRGLAVQPTEALRED